MDRVVLPGRGGRARRRAPPVFLLPASRRGSLSRRLGPGQGGQTVAGCGNGCGAAPGAARPRAQAMHALPGCADELPDGSVIAAAGEAYTLAHGRAFRWAAHGYQGPIEIPRADALLTLPSTLGALRAGYRPATQQHGTRRDCFVRSLFGKVSGCRSSTTASRHSATSPRRRRSGT